MVRLSSVFGTTAAASCFNRGFAAIPWIAACLAAMVILAGCKKDGEPSDAPARGAPQTWVQQDQPIEQLAAPPSTQPVEWPEPQIIVAEEEKEKADPDAGAAAAGATTQPGAASNDVVIPPRKVAT